MHKNITRRMYPDSIKRLFDLVVSSIAFVIILPLFLPLCLFLYFRNNGQPFFLQTRPGFRESPFKVIKFKTMTDANDSEGNLLPNHLRITNTGRILRKYSLDELPQLINVIKGEMSLVGPRPLLFKYIPLYSEEQRKRHLVKPGITGWAQVNGRNAISWTKKLEYDVWYVENLTLLLDLKILLMTVFKILKSEGINAGENLTMPPFNGKN